MNRLRAGYVITRNPMNRSQITCIELSPKILDCIVFWTKDPQPMMQHLEELDRLGYNYYFHFTLTPYDRKIERNLRAKCEIEDTFLELSKKIGKDRVVWRYDPILFNDTIDIDYHKLEFKRMCGILSPYTDTVVISFVDQYSKNKHVPLHMIKSDEIEALSGYISGTAREYGLRATACCEESRLSHFGIEQSACIDIARIERITGSTLRIKRDQNQRTGCGCCESVDIGAYNTCLNDCIYCYANTGFDVAVKNYKTHNPYSDVLLGTIKEHENARHKVFKSNLYRQISLFDDRDTEVKLD